MIGFRKRKCNRKRKRNRKLKCKRKDKITKLIMKRFYKIESVRTSVLMDEFGCKSKSSIVIFISFESIQFSYFNVNVIVNLNVK